jgi:hypothetical protein
MKSITYIMGFLISLNEYKHTELTGSGISREMIQTPICVGALSSKRTEEVQEIIIVGLHNCFEL